MELQSARQIIDTLAQGVHPVTGELMPQDSPYNAPPVIRALSAVARALESAPPRPSRVLPANAGKPWTAEHDQALLAAFDGGAPLKQLMHDLGRTRFAVEARLVKLGKIPPRGGVPFHAPAAA